MSRFLFVVPPLAGHVYPASAVAQALTDRGHQVVWVGSPSRLGSMLGPGADIHPAGMRLYRGRADTGMAAVRSLWEGFAVPFARHLLPTVDEAVRVRRPDVIVADQHAFAGALAAERHGLPWATLCTSTMELARPFAAMPKVEEWIQGHLDALRCHAGLPAADGTDLRFSPHLVIAFTGPPLMCGSSAWEPVVFTGPALVPRPDAAAFPWRWLRPDRRRVLVTVGTLAPDAAAAPGHFYDRAVAAFHPLAETVQVIVTAPDGVLADIPGHVFAAARVPVADLMPHLDAVVCHGGLNTVSEALLSGVPLVVAPVRHDQPVNATQVVAAGAGVQVRFARASPADLRRAVLTVLDDPGYARAARAAGESLAAAGGARAAAEELQLLARRAGARGLS